MNKTPIRLVYHFYDNLDLDNEIIKLHLYCLKYFANIFNEVIFIISVDDLDNIEHISEIESKVCLCGFKGNIQFKIIKNDPIRREAETFADEILNKLNEYSGITFFAHSKGISNNNNESLKQWIASLYFFNLNYMNDVKKDLLEYNSCLFWGYNPVFDKGEDRGSQAWNNKYAWIFPGTIYWMNTKRIYNHLKNEDIEILTENRWLAENFPGDVCEFSPKYVGYNSRYYGINLALWYTEAVKYISSIVVYKDKLKEFNDFYQKLLKDIKN